MKRIAVIGAGAAGLMAAVTAADNGAEVTLIEQNEKIGKKIYITGKGRCNLTNACPVSEFFENVPTNPKFLYSSVRSFDSADLCAFFENAGLKLKTERGNRVFPVSDKSSDVIRTMQKECSRTGVRILLNTKVTDVFMENVSMDLPTDAADHSEKPSEGAQARPFVFAESDGNRNKLIADAVIIATGGLSYPSTGSTGDGFGFAERFGHGVIAQLPSLVPIRLKEQFVCGLEGLSLRNVALRIAKQPDAKPLFEDFGEMLFTGNGVSGPLILTASSAVGRKISDEKDLKLIIDLKPALDSKQLDARILRDFDEAKNKEFKNALGKLLPAKMIPVIIAVSGISPDTRVHDISKKQRAQLVRSIKQLTFTIDGLEGFDKAVITKGGVDVRTVDPKTMESKLVPGLYFAGEVLDVDAYTGGFNLQIAFSTGRAAGLAAARKTKSAANKNVTKEEDVPDEANNKDGKRHVFKIQYEKSRKADVAFRKN